MISQAVKYTILTKPVVSNDSIIYLISKIATCAEKYDRYVVLHKWVLLFNFQKRLQLFFGCSTISVTLVLVALIIFKLTFYIYSWLKQQHKFNLWNNINLLNMRELWSLEDIFVMYCVDKDLKNCMTESRVKSFQVELNFPLNILLLF